MAKNNNLQDFLTDIANSIRTKTGTTDPINAQDFSNKILNIASGENTLKKLLDVTKHTSFLFADVYRESLDGLIQYNDTENVTKMWNMFSGCAILKAVPAINTSKVTNMSYMFSSCQYLTTIPLLDTGNVTNMTYMFSSCFNLTSVPQFNTSNVTDMGFMFFGCRSLTTVPLLDTSKVTNMTYMFNGCNNLTTVPALDASNVTNMGGMFGNCTKLKTILMTNIGVNLDISASTQFERSDLLVILNNLKTVTETKTLTMGADNLAKLTDEDKAIAINKGWTLA